MNIWAISDLHLSFSTNKPMDIFGENWQNHPQKIAKNWDLLISNEDYVLIPGDISWAMNLLQAQLDLDWINQRPGKKILTRGNHDYWWDSIGKVRAALATNCRALQNDAIDIGEFIIAGTRMWAVPGAIDYKVEDQKIYERELIRLKLSLDHAKKLSSTKPVIAMIHYPPFTKYKAHTDVTKLLEEYKVHTCIYGHLHTKKSHQTANVGLINNINYYLVACDYLDFVPVKICNENSTDL